MDSTSISELDHEDVPQLNVLRWNWDPFPTIITQIVSSSLHKTHYNIQYCVILWLEYRQIDVIYMYDIGISKPPFFQKPPSTVSKHMFFVHMLLLLSNMETKACILFNTSIKEKWNENVCYAAYYSTKETNMFVDRFLDNPRTYSSPSPRCYKIF